MVSRRGRLFASAEQSAARSEPIPHAGHLIPQSVNPLAWQGEVDMKVSVLASGSRGNVCFIDSGEARILVDAGLSCKEIVRRLGILGVDPGTLDGVVITHEHLDHVRGAALLARRFQLPIYTNSKTFDRCFNSNEGEVTARIIQSVQTGTIKDLTLETFTKCHDAVDPFGLVVSRGKKKIGFATDLGRSTRLVEDRLKGCKILIMEFNHDEAMLMAGPYPLSVKRRILGQDGHLSNRQAMDLLSALCWKDLELVVVAHMSEANNDSDKAVEAAADGLSRRGLKQVELMLGKQQEPGPLIEL
jgi:phosphoribosyl 1,2-cyclic phosphodiesterase